MPKITITDDQGKSEEVEVSKEAVKRVAVELATVGIRADMNPLLKVDEDIRKELMKIARIFKSGAERR